MAVWYCGSVQHAAIAQFAISTVYSVGDIIRQLAAPAAGNERAFRCTTAGTSAGSEPSWNLTKGATTTSNTAVFTEVTGNSTYGWSAAHSRIANAVKTGWPAAGDRVYVANDHNYSIAASYSFLVNGSIGALFEVICVDPAGSVPPVSADLSTGAIEATTGASHLTIGASGGTNYTYFRGITFKAGDSSNLARLQFSAGGSVTNVMIFEACQLVINNTSASAYMEVGGLYGADSLIVLKNTPVTFGATGQTIRHSGGKFRWLNTASAILGSVATILITPNTNSGHGEVLLDGVDLSAAGSGKTLIGASASSTVNAVLQNCKLGASVTVAITPTTRTSSVSLINGDSGATGNRQERYTYEGTLTTESTIVRTGGASDGVASLSWKVVTTANSKFIFPFETFPLAIWNGVVGSPVTATIEIVNDGTTLKDDEIWIEAEYLGTSGFPVSSFISDSKADILATGADQTSSSVTWTTTGLSSPVKQKLSVTFTPQMAGYVRLMVKIAKAAQTVYIDPKVALS